MFVVVCWFLALCVLILISYAVVYHRIESYLSCPFSTFLFSNVNTPDNKTSKLQNFKQGKKSKLRQKDKDKGKGKIEKIKNLNKENSSVQ